MPGRPSFPVRMALLGAVLVGACTTTGSTASPPGAAATPTATAGASLAVASAPSPTARPPVIAATAVEPPAASLRAEGGDPVVGQLGSYTWAGGGSDSPWLQGSPIRIGAGEPLLVTVVGDPAVGAWAARRVAAGTTDGRDAAALGPGSASPIRFVAPGAGRWSIQVTIQFADGSDTAAYYWLLDVR